MKTLFLLLIVLGICQQKREDTTASQVKKIEIKAAQIKARPRQHNVEDVYTLLMKSTSLTRQVIGKSDSTNMALKKANADIRAMLKKQDELQSGVNNGRIFEQQMYVVNKFIDSVPIAFAGTALFFVIGILIKRSHSIAV